MVCYDIRSNDKKRRCSAASQRRRNPILENAVDRGKAIHRTAQEKLAKQESAGAGAGHATGNVVLHITRV